MGFAVLHIQKPKGNDSGTTAHIERAVNPANADPERKHLNKEFIDFPDGVVTRTQAIQHRIENAGIKRKISHNQVRTLQVMLSGTHEDIMHIHAGGRLNEWCRDNIAWLQDTFGSENVVSAVLHLDEKTPHIHATVVPIVTGERRKAKERNPDEQGKKKYRKKNPDTTRLCADDVMTRQNLERFQDSYAEAMNKYGLRRGIKGSDARHISTPQYYRDLYAKNEDLKEDIGLLEDEREEANNIIRSLYDQKDEAREKFLNMDTHLREKEQELSDLESRLDKLKQDYEPYQAQDELNLLTGVFPGIMELLQISRFCKAIGLTTDFIKKLLAGERVSFSGKLHSPDHDSSFEVSDAKLRLSKDRDNSGTLILKLNGQNILEWFGQKYDELKQAVKTHVRPVIPPKKESKMTGPG